jgi:hypothetical protein
MKKTRIYVIEIINEDESNNVIKDGVNYLLDTTVGYDTKIGVHYAWEGVKASTVLITAPTNYLLESSPILVIKDYAHYISDSFIYIDDYIPITEAYMKGMVGAFALGSFTFAAAATCGDMYAKITNPVSIKYPDIEYPNQVHPEYLSNIAAYISSGVTAAGVGGVLIYKADNHNLLGAITFAGLAGAFVDPTIGLSVAAAGLAGEIAYYYNTYSEDNLA